MKKSILNNLLVMCFVTANLSAAMAFSSNPIFKSVTVEVVLLDDSDSHNFSVINFDQNTDNLVFEMESEVSFVQIFDNQDELIFQLPVMSTKLSLGTSLFETGQYKLGFMLEGQNEIIFTDVKIN